MEGKDGSENGCDLPGVAEEVAAGACSAAVVVILRTLDRGIVLDRRASVLLHVLQIMISGGRQGMVEGIEMLIAMLEMKVDTICRYSTGSEHVILGMVSEVLLEALLCDMIRQ